MLRFAWVVAALSLVGVALVAATPAASPNFPTRIDLPTGWRAEGIAVGRGHTFYAGNTLTGAVYAGDLRTGDGSVLVPGATGRSAFGVFADNRDRLFVAGGTTGKAFVYDASTGALIKEYTLAPTAPRFINDVTVTNDGAYFTNTAGDPVLFKIPIAPNGELGDSAETLTLTPAVAGGNGIEATPDGKTLIMVSITLSKFFTVDPATGATHEIVLDQPVLRGDGLILQGRTLYAAENLPSAAVPGVPGAVAEIELSPDLSTGHVVGRLNNADDPLVNPATIDRFGQLIYVVRRDAPAPAPPAFHLTRLDEH
jgi:hypothetical protein